ncbi:hypothetical protein OROGR_024067 [Orobanche gracilis]
MRWVFRVSMECDSACISELRMDRATFRVLCDMIRDVGGLKATRNTSVEEVVSMFLYTLAHHKKSRTIGLLFHRSTETVSRQFHQVLLAVLRLHDILLKKPEPITQDCQDEKWKCFQGCLGALDEKDAFQETIDTKFDTFTDKFESVCSQMTSQYAAVTHALISKSKSNTLDEAKMQEVINELLNLGISPVDIGRAAEICHNDPAKVQVLFALPSHLRVSFVLGFIHPTSKP